MGFFKKQKIKRNNEGFIDIEVKDLLDWNQPHGDGCIASDMITKEGWKVGYMYRDEPSSLYPDSGWRFFKGDEDEEYSQDASCHHIFKLNTMCNYDPDITAYLHLPIGTCLIRINEHEFIQDDGSKPIYMQKQKR